MLTPEHIRAARALLHWSARELAEHSGVHITTIQRMERSKGPLRGSTESLRKIENAFGIARVEFLQDDDRPGVRLDRLRAEGDGE